MPKKVRKEEKDHSESSTKKETGISYYEATGRRKSAIARVRLYIAPGEINMKDMVMGRGDIFVNNLPASKYFPGEVFKKLYMEPFQLTSTQGRYAISAFISGGGLSGQVGAFRHGIARVLEKIDKETYRPILKKSGLMTRDPREKERRKAGNAQKARAKKQSPKR